MTSYAELLETCTEFQENFNILNAKYSALRAEHKATEAQKARLQSQLEEGARRAEQLDGRLRALQAELTAAQSYKERYVSTNLMLERAKGQIEQAARAAADAASAHSEEVAQLRAQMKDLLRRIDVATSSGQLHELQKQLREVEERAAGQSAQLLEQRERFNQELLTAHNALREQQGRQLALEQRCRIAEGEVNELRATLRRSAEVQNAAAALTERHRTELELAQRELAAARKDVAALQAQLAAAQQTHEEQRAEAAQAAAAERQALQLRLSALNRSVGELGAQRVADAQRLRALQDATAAQVEAARQEAALELRTLRQTLGHVKEEQQRLQWRAEGLQDDLSSARRAAAQQTTQLQTAQTELQALRQQLDAAVQQEAWLRAERAHLLEQQALLEKRLEASAIAAREHDALRDELERAALLLRSREVELAEAQQTAREAERRLQLYGEAAQRRTAMLKHEVRQLRRALRSEANKSDALRHRLLDALTEREVRLSCGPGGAEQKLERETRGSGGGGAAAAQRTAQATDDVLVLLREQTEQAAQLCSHLEALAPAQSAATAAATAAA